MQLNFLSSQIIHAALSVHKELGPGLLESVYQQCMVIELRENGLNVQSEVELPVRYHGHVKDTRPGATRNSYLVTCICVLPCALFSPDRPDQPNRPNPPNQQNLQTRVKRRPDPFLHGDVKC